MDQIRQSMIKAARELRALARATTEPALKNRLLEQADQLEHASQEESQIETNFVRGRSSLESRLSVP
jgi:hypothetical protein